MRFLYDGHGIHMDMEHGEKKSVLISGGSRLERTFLGSNLASKLIQSGSILQIIDFGEQWNMEDRTRFINVGAVEKVVKQQGVKLSFSSMEELAGCARYMMNALGLRSIKTEAVLEKFLLKQYNRAEGCLSIKGLVDSLAKDKGENQQEHDEIDELYSCLNSYGCIPNITFCVNGNIRFSDSNIIWNLAGLDDTYTRVTAYLITYCLYQQKKRDFMDNSKNNRVVIVVNGFQDLDCDSDSIIGVCLTDGWRYGLNLMLITPLLSGNFSEAILRELMQKCFRFHFRISEEEAVVISWHLAFDYSIQRRVYQKLVNLSRGECLFFGLHSVGEEQSILEMFWFLEVKMDMDDSEKEVTVTVQVILEDSEFSRCRAYATRSLWKGGK